MSDVPGGEADARPNLTPLLDMVFQLITFFMLVINFKSAALDMSLTLPVVGSARPVETNGEEILVLNVNKVGDLKVYGNTYTNVEGYIAGEARASRLTAKMTEEAIDKDGLPTIIVIRADADTSFHLLNRVITACQDNGFRRFALKANNKAG